MTMTLKLEQRDWPHGYRTDPTRVTLADCNPGDRIRIPDAEGSAAGGEWVLRKITADPLTDHSITIDVETVNGQVGERFNFDPASPIDRLGTIQPCELKQTWIADVERVAVLGRVHPDNIARLDVDYAWLNDTGGIEYHTWCGEDTEDHADRIQGTCVYRTLLLVITSRGNTHMLVERAWLLSETGSTIERIAP